MLASWLYRSFLIRPLVRESLNASFENERSLAMNVRSGIRERFDLANPLRFPVFLNSSEQCLTDALSAVRRSHCENPDPALSFCRLRHELHHAEQFPIRLR